MPSFCLATSAPITHGIGNCKRSLKRLKKIAGMQRMNGRPLIDDSRFRDRIAQVELELMALRSPTCECCRPRRASRVHRALRRRY